MKTRVPLKVMCKRSARPNSESDEVRCALVHSEQRHVAPTCISEVIKDDNNEW